MTATLTLIPVRDIAPSPDQNRTDFDPERLAELAASIASGGLDTPITVRVIDGAYVLVAGERRLRACRDLLDWATIPALVRDDMSDADAAIGTLRENMVRADPSPLEEAQGLAHALESCSLTAAELAVKLGKRPAWVRDRLALLALAPDVAHWIATKSLPINRGVLMAALDVNRQRLALQAHERGISPDAFRVLVARLADDQASESMFDTESFLSVEEYVVDAERSLESEPEVPVTAVREDPLGPQEIAELLGVQRATVDQWAARGRLCEPDMRVSGRPLWWKTTIEDWARATGRL